MADDCGFRHEVATVRLIDAGNSPPELQTPESDRAKRRCIE